MSPLVICLFVAAGVVALMAFAPLLFKPKDAQPQAAQTPIKPSLADKVHALAVDAGNNIEAAFEKAKADLANLDKQLKAHRAQRQAVELSVVATAASQLDALYKEAANIVDAAERDEALKKLAETAAVVLPYIIKAGVMLPK